jgi:hypothetical protein
VGKNERETIGGKQLPEIIQQEIIVDIGGSNLFVQTCLHIYVSHISSGSSTMSLIHHRLVVQ